MYTLYGTKTSGAAAIEAALALLDVPYKVVDAASWEPGAGLDELKQVNPLAQIPTLVLPDGSVMTESAAILIHLGLAYPHSGLLPTDLSDQAQAIRGLVYIAANCYAAIGVIDYPERWVVEANENTLAAIKLGTRLRLHTLWDIFADHWPATPFLNGTAPGALDFLAVVVSKWSGARAHLQASRPAFSELLTRIELHPAFAPVQARYWP
ncbi:GST-like protein [Silvimonas terrae]|uniref:GST-like protein n=1 Tax=Silvimonas terrae TaxID=300266 RepID=A0A840RJ76_9NEIS|nr:glutathione S-transferase family protein [Silvimonas terrae]MBB5193365.1 GST-like protein [Silvimonas terrae]